MAINPKDDITIGQYDFSLLESLQIPKDSLVDILASFTSLGEINDISKKFQYFVDDNNNVSSTITSSQNLEIKYNVTEIGKQSMVMIKFINNTSNSIVNASEIGYSIKVDDKPILFGSTTTGKDIKVFDTPDLSMVNINITRYP